MRYTLLFAAVVMVAACREATKPPPPDPMIGDYPLRTVDGNQPPQIIQEDSTGRLSILAGMVRLRADRSFLDSTDVQLVRADGDVQSQSEVARGTWVVLNDTLYLSPIGSETYKMAVTITGFELTQDFGSITLVYRK